MFDRYDPRDDDRRDRDEDGIRDREQQWLSMGRWCGITRALRDGDDPESGRHHWHGREDRGVRGRERDDNEPAGVDPRDVFMRDAGSAARS